MVKRFENIDFIKGVLIMLVVMGHIIQALDSNYEKNFIYFFIYSFHMPLFMSVSGYLFCLKYNFEDWGKEETKIFVAKLGNIAYPMLIWGGVVLLLT